MRPSIRAAGVIALLLLVRAVSAVPAAQGRQAAPPPAQPATRPNIVLMVPDNLGWGEVGAYGSVRGNVTPRIDKLAAEGIRLTNFNVEFSCTVSRAALLTGRYAIRTGATQGNGMTLWEVTIAEGLKTVGYATGLFGKYHVGGDAPEGKRDPGQQGFDEFYGIPRTSNEAQTTIANGQTGTRDVIHLGGRHGQAHAQRQALRHGDTPHRRSRVGRARHCVHGARGEGAPAVLHVLPDHPDPFPDAGASGLRGQDGRGRHRGRDGRHRSQRRPGARRAGSAADEPQHDRVLVPGQRRRTAAAVARIRRPVERFLQHRDGRRRARAVHHPVAGPHSGRPCVE